MSATNAFETSLLGLIFTNVAAANVGDVGGLQPSATAGVLWISLHTASPGETGTQETSEATYTDYEREDVARSGAGWTVTGATADNAAAITFIVASGGSSTVTFVGIGSTESTASAGNLFLYAAKSGGGLAVTSGVQPNIAIGALDVSLD